VTPTVLEAIASVIACGGAAAAIVLRDPRWRYLAMGIGLLAAVALITGQVWDQARFADIRDKPQLLLAGALFGGVALGATASIFVRAPAAFAIAALIVLSLRVPVQVGGETNFLLVPLYGVIAAGFVRAAWLLLRGRTGELVTPSSSREGEPPAVRRLCLALAASLFVYGMAVAWGHDSGNATRAVAFFLTPFASMFVLLRDLRWYRKMVAQSVAAFVAIALLFAAIAIYQHQSRSLILNTDLLDANQLHIYFRVNSLFRDPNVLGRYLAIAIVAVMAYVAYSDRKLHVITGSALSLFLLLALLFTFSISSMGALLVGLGILAWIRMGRAGLASAAAIAVIGALAFVLVGSPSDSTNGARDRLEGRDNLVSGGIDMFEKRPIAGFGSGSFAISYRREIKKIKQPVSHAEPITVAAEEGILGLIPYAAVLIFSGLLLFRPWPGLTPIRAGVAACYTALFIHTLGYAGFLIDPVTWALLALGIVALALEVRPSRPAAAATPAG
jgi:O-antigen ligase